MGADAGRGLRPARGARPIAPRTELLELADGLARPRRRARGRDRRRRCDRGAGAAPGGHRRRRGRRRTCSCAAPARGPATCSWSPASSAGRPRAGAARAPRARRRAAPSRSPTALRRRQLEPVPRLAAGSALAVRRGEGDDRPQRRARRRRRAPRRGERGPARDRRSSALPVQRASPRSRRRPASTAFDLAAAGGEDYELLAAIAAERLESATAALVAATGVGADRRSARSSAGEGVRAQWARG